MKVKLRVSNLGKRFLSSNGMLHVLDGISVDIYENEFFCIVGQSGCGKSTFLRALAGFEGCEGRIELNGAQIRAPGPDRFVVFQEFDQLFPWRTVWGNIEFGLRLKKVSAAKRREMVEALI